MRKFLMVCATAAAALVSMTVCCNKNNSNNPSGPDIPAGEVVFNDGFVGNPDSILANYRPVVYGQGLMTLSSQYEHAPGHQSLTSDSNNTTLKGTPGISLDDSIVGIEFYLYAVSPGEINFIAALTQTGSALNGLAAIVGMGIDKSDSFKIFYQEAYNQEAQDSIVQKNVAPLGYNKWYKCNVEYNFNRGNDTLTCFLNDAVVFAQPTPNPPGGFNSFVVMRDTLGSQGPKGYYLGDITVYNK